LIEVHMLPFKMTLQILLVNCRA